MLKYLSFLVIFYAFVDVLAQNERYPYGSPLNIPLTLAGNFGELRPNHFHMGLDFKTHGKEGFTLHAVEDGYISRVKISTYGYGKAVYIDHPNGKTSVYAHCSKFVGALDSFVLAEQKRLMSFEIELFFDSITLPVKKGEVFALSGNTGGSTAPHLHFEIRDTKTEHALNPLVYAFDLSDKRPPELRNVKVFAVNEQGFLAPHSPKEFRLMKAVGSNYLSVQGDTMIIPSHFATAYGGIGFAIDANDRLDGSDNLCGLYGLDLIVDGDTLFGQRINEISFDQSRYINSHRDMSDLSKHYHKAFRNSSNPLLIYNRSNLGVLQIFPGEIKQIELIGFDPKGNKTRVKFVVRMQDGSISEDFNPSVDDYWYPEDGLEVKHKTWELQADPFTVYEPVKVTKRDVPHLCEAGVHLQKNATIRMKLANPSKPIEKYYLAVTGKGGVRRALSTKYENGWLVAKSNTSGNFSILIDETPPVIKPITNIYQVKTPVVKFSLSDAQSGLSSYRLFIDGEWHLLEYEYKGNYVFFEVPKELKGKHLIQIIATDQCGNEAIWEGEMNFI